MTVVLRKEEMTAVITTQGAQLRSLRKGDREYIWPGDEKLWPDSCLTLFPFIGRCAENGYFWKGHRYEMGLHGFAHKTDFSLEAQSGTSCTLRMSDTEKTWKGYPFSFVFRVCYTLEKTGICVEYQIENLGGERMGFALGGHPGFLLDLEHNQLTDHYVEFEAGTVPIQKEIVTLCMRTGRESPVALDGSKLWITPELFRTSAQVMEAPGGAVWLGCRKEGRILKLEKEAFRYLTLWQTLGSGAPFLCIEPWSSMPGSCDGPEELTQREDLLWVQPGAAMKKAWSIQLCV